MVVAKRVQEAGRPEGKSKLAWIPKLDCSLPSDFIVGFSGYLEKLYYTLLEMLLDY